MKRFLSFCAVTALLVSASSIALCDTMAASTPAPAPTLSDKPDVTQASVASKGTFKTEPAAKASKALAATDLKTALSLVGKKGSFQGTVTDTYAPDGDGILFVDFAKNYRTTISAVLFAKSYSKFPEMSTLDGQHILVSGTFASHEGRPQIILDDPKQITILK